MALMTPQEYIESLRKLNTRVYMFGEKIENWVDHPMIRPSINCVAMTYALAQDPQYAELMTVKSSLTGHTINRFTHLHQSTEDLMNKVKMQRLLGQKTASCFQRCVGMDAFNSVFSTTYEIDEKYGTHYHENFKKFLTYVQDNDLTVDGAMTDPKGDRSKSPSQQADPDMYVHVVERRPDGIVVCGAKCHQTGSINSHWHIFMPTISMSELYQNVYQGRPPIIDGLLDPGTYLFAGAPKVGKSFLMAQLAYHVSMGLPLWDYPVHKGTVLYLALEDDHRRLQGRLYRMFGMGGTNDLLFAIHAKQLGVGLEGQLKMFVREHPDTKLIIIDTLQKIREVSTDAYSYANDYDIVGRMKQFADKNGVCLLLVHHTRKQQAGDKFEMISGTTGLLGCADGAFLLQKEKRTDLSATLEIVGRDQPDQKLHLTRDAEKLIWQLDHAETELWKSPPDPLLDKIAAVITEDAPIWNGSATELVALLQEDIQPNILTRRLNVKAGDLLNDYSIEYAVKRTRNGSFISLTRKRV